MAKLDARANAGVTNTKPGPVRTSSGTRQAIRLEPQSPPIARAPSANDGDDTKQFHAAELREMALRCASDVLAEPKPPSSPPPELVALVDDEDILEDVDEQKDAALEAAFFAAAAHAAEVARPTSPPASIAPPVRRSEIPVAFRREILGEGYFARRCLALTLLLVVVAVLGAGAIH